MLKCGYAQGSLFSRPIDGEAAEALLRKKVSWQVDAAQGKSKVERMKDEREAIQR
jgi:hypothetical protein